MPTASEAEHEVTDVQSQQQTVPSPGRRERGDVEIRFGSRL